jgi:toxin ParE1/3/4
MIGFLLTPAAQRDLDTIWDFTAERWSLDQANKYILAIRDACEELAAGKRRTEPIDDIRPGYRKSQVASHIIFFRTTDNGFLDIIRVLHQRMDHTTHLHDDDFIH